MVNPHNPDHFECPNCGEEFVRCHIVGCNKWAVWEGWMGTGLVRRVGVCEEHADQLRGWEKHLHSSTGQSA